MLVSYLWLKELVDFDLTPESLAVALTDLGLETSIADDRRGWYENVVTGRVVETATHPNADKLKLCKVHAGSGTKSIVCGAVNVAEGQAVAVALVGAKLPGGVTIERRKVRGELSEGMMVSEAELMLSGDHDGILTLDDNPPPGEKFGERYEVCDTILEVDLTPNRGDCLSMIGIARETAAVTGSRLNMPDASFNEDGSDNSSNHIKVEIKAPDLCPRYSGRMIVGLSPGPSPFWMRRRLSSVGLRSINNLVDVTNYVLIETGHPLHAFDHSMISGSRIIVRRAKAGERFVTLDSRTHTLDNDNLVIADAAKPVALAGVMGGENSEVTGSTTDVMLEAAFFDPASIRRTSKGLGIKSESSFRFERGTDVEGMIYAQDRATKLMAELGGGRALKGRVDAYPAPVERKKISLRYKRADKILGVDTPPDRAKEILARLGMNIADQDDLSVTVMAPQFRFDIEREIDLVEEIARFVGYNNVVSAIPEVPANTSGVGPELESRRSLRRHLISLGMMEGLRASFVSEADLDKLRLRADDPLRNLVKIDNPLSSDWTHLRSSLLPGMLSATGSGDIMIFEIGVVFSDAGDQPPNEKRCVAGIVSESMDPGLWSGRAGKRDIFHAKGIVESAMASLGFKNCLYRLSSHPFYYPKRQGDVIAGDAVLGHFGQIHPETLESYNIPQEIFAFELDLGKTASLPVPVAKHSPLSRIPSVKRDLAVLVKDDITSEQLEKSIFRHGGGKTREAVLFDVYSGEKIGPGLKSVAFSLEFRDDEKTMTDDQANAVFDRILEGLKTDCGARLR